MSLKRTAADAMERALGVRIVRPGLVATVFEEEHLRRFFKHFAVDCVFDVGANAGQYATMLRERVGYQGFVISFEPIPALAHTIRGLAQNDPRWLVEEAALDRDVGTAAFNVSTDSQFSSLHASRFDEVDLFEKDTAVVERIEVTTTTVARELAKYRERLGFSRPFLKMDTQGHDVAVAEGAGSALRDFVGLQSELAIKRIYDGAPSHDEALHFYRTRGFELSAFVPNNGGHFPRLIEIDCIMYRVSRTTRERTRD
jgi:FkbM family methyltransferase